VFMVNVFSHLATTDAKRLRICDFQFGIEATSKKMLAPLNGGGYKRRAPSNLYSCHEPRPGWSPDRGVCRKHRTVLLVAPEKWLDRPPGVRRLMLCCRGTIVRDRVHGSVRAKAGAERGLSGSIVGFPTCAAEYLRRGLLHWRHWPYLRDVGALQLGCRVLDFCRPL